MSFQFSKSFVDNNLLSRETVEPISMFQYAITNQSPSVVALLDEYASNKDLIVDSIFYALEFGNDDYISSAIKKVSDIVALNPSRNGKTLLEWAVMTGNSKLVIEFSNFNFTQSSPDLYQLSTLSDTCDSNMLSLIDNLAPEDYLETKKYNAGESPLVLALQHGRKEIFMKLFDRISITSDVLLKAIEYGDIEILRKVFAKSGDFLNTQEPATKMTALHKTILKMENSGNPSDYEKLLISIIKSPNVDWKLKDNSNRSALTYADDDLLMKVIKHLEASGDEKNLNVILSDYDANSKQLLEQNDSTKNQFDKMNLSFALKYKLYNRVEHLLQNGAVPNDEESKLINELKPKELKPSKPKKEEKNPSKANEKVGIKHLIICSMVLAILQLF